MAGLTKAEAQDIITQYTGVSVDKQDAAFQKFKGLPGSRQKSMAKEALGDLFAAFESSRWASDLDWQFADCPYSADFRNPNCSLLDLIDAFG